MLQNPPKIPLLTPELAFLIPEIVVVPYQRPGSDELAEAVAEALFDCDIVIMENHGVIVAADTLERAAAKTRAMEEYLEKLENNKKNRGNNKKNGGVVKTCLTQKLIRWFPL